MYIVVEPSLGNNWGVNIPGFIGLIDEPIGKVPGLVAGFMDEVRNANYSDRIPEVDLKTNRTNNCIVIAPDLFLNPDADMWFIYTPDGMRRTTRLDLMLRLPWLMSNLGKGCVNTVEVEPGSYTHKGKVCRYGVREEPGPFLPAPDSENLSIYKVNGGFIAVDDSDNEYVFTTAASIAEWVGRWGSAPEGDGK